MIEDPSPRRRQKKQTADETEIRFFEDKDILLLFKFKRESIEKKDFEGEPFFIGSFRVFMQQEKCYSADLWSKPFLNPALNWNKDSFLLFLEEMRYFKVGETEEEMITEYSLAIDTITQSKSVLLLKLKVHEEVGINVKNQLWTEIQKYSAFSERMIEKKLQIFKGKQLAYNCSLDHLEIVRERNAANVQKLKSKLSILLYEKQTKLMEVSGNRRKFQYHLKEGLNDQKVMDYKAAEWMSSQSDHQLIGSLFAPSQNDML